MLESTIWRQYNSENNFREKLAEFCVMNVDDMVADDKELYGILKAKLTKKELKLFAMDSAKMSDEALKNEFDYTDEELKEAKYKVYKKLKQDKMRAALKGITYESAE
ncbi:MAG: hypothetical protein FP820_12375 [Sulfurimonas sp.]|jgi:hypothetical protein|nr:hypothetical protein [Sulfurimonas sp.]MBU3938643.1 hypothetical protein [bacterium]MBU4025179.1 hypothetical protein [bacterium]MBU4058490.1 hypothetical protein [bacterium]MBU4110443.1 hypothetical protein [bacterium]